MVDDGDRGARLAHVKRRGEPASEDYRRLFHSMTDGAALFEVIIDDAGAPIDYRFLDVNPAYELIVGVKRADRIGRRLSELRSATPAPFAFLAKVVTSGEPMEYETSDGILDK